MPQTQAPQMRLFQLDWKPQDLPELLQVGQHNFSQSLAQEPGTLTMLMGHPEEAPEQTVVVEIYQDEPAYQAHVASPHFQSFAAFAQDHIQGRQVTELAPQVLLEKPDQVQVFEDQGYALRLAQLTLKTGAGPAFRAIVQEEMEAAVAQEAGVVFLFGAQVVDQPDQWVFVELYRDAAAYQAHRETPHFAAYIAGTQDLVADKRLSVLVPDLLVSQGGLTYLA